LHASGSGGPEARAKATAKARGAGNAKGRGGRAEADERGGNARASDGASDAAPETNGLSNAEDEEETKNGKETFSLEKRRLWELQARFTRAAAELEFLGVARPVKRRKVEYMQRTAFPLDQLLGEDGL
jgi:origin recognition complex subunit 3